MESPTSSFDAYEQDFNQLVSSIQKQLDGDGTSEHLDQRNATFRRVEMELDEADEMISQMEIELQGMHPSLKQQNQSRLRTAKATLTRYKNLAKEFHAQLTRHDLLSSPGIPSTSDDPYGPSSDRTRLLAGAALLEDGTKRLQESHRIALETENQGADILMNLRSQREQIEHSRDTLHLADGSIDRASNTLKRMIVRMYQQRAVTAAIVFVLILLIVIIIWEKLQR